MKALLAVVASMTTVALFAASPLTPGNVVLATPNNLNGELFEYQPDGTLVQTVVIPAPTLAYYPPGGLTFDDRGVLWIFNGWGNADMASWYSQQDVWTHRSCAGWGSFQCFPCQGIGTWGYFVFATSEGNRNGLVQFDRRNTNACIRFAEGHDYSALAVGLDGVLYARQADDVDPPPPTVIDEFDPKTLAKIRSVTLSDRSLSIAADAQGQLYGASGAYILQYHPDGMLLDSHQVITNSGLVTDSVYTLILSQDQRFVAVSGFGVVVITDFNFAVQSRFSVPGLGGYAAIVPPLPPKLSIKGATNAVVIFWPSSASGWTVQQNNDLNTSKWTDLANTPNDDGTNNSITISPTVGLWSYRLNKQ